MPGREPEIFVRCSDPNIICETKKMVPFSQGGQQLLQFTDCIVLVIAATVPNLWVYRNLNRLLLGRWPRCFFEIVSQDL